MTVLGKGKKNKGLKGIVSVRLSGKSKYVCIREVIFLVLMDCRIYNYSVILRYEYGTLCSFATKFMGVLNGRYRGFQEMSQCFEWTLS